MSLFELLCDLKYEQLSSEVVNKAVHNYMVGILGKPPYTSEPEIKESNEICDIKVNLSGSFAVICIANNNFAIIVTKFFHTTKCEILNYGIYRGGAILTRDIVMSRFWLQLCFNYGARSDNVTFADFLPKTIKSVKPY